MSDEVASSPALDLLLRLVGQQLASRRCPGCNGPLARSGMRVQEHDEQQVVVEVTCRRCNHAVVVKMSPEAASR